MNWTLEDQMKAHQAGWGIFRNSDHGLQIERLDDPSSVGLPNEVSFVSDEDAAAHVIAMANKGDLHAQKAVDYILISIDKELK